MNYTHRYWCYYKASLCSLYATQSEAIHCILGSRASEGVEPLTQHVDGGCPGLGDQQLGPDGSRGGVVAGSGNEDDDDEGNAVALVAQDRLGRLLKSQAAGSSPAHVPQILYVCKQVHQ